MGCCAAGGPFPTRVVTASQASQSPAFRRGIYLIATDKLLQLLCDEMAEGRSTPRGKRFRFSRKIGIDLYRNVRCFHKSTLDSGMNGPAQRRSNADRNRNVAPIVRLALTNVV